MLEALLVLQGHDTSADQLRHRLEALPQKESLARLRSAAKAQDVLEAELRSRREGLAASQRRLEDEASMVEAKGAEESQRMYSGSVTAARELQALQQEIEALGRRQRQLEDQIIELMEQIEPLDAELASAASVREAIDADISAAEADLSSATEAIEAELSEVEEVIGAEREGIDPALLDRYDKMRRQLGGIAIARLVGGSCGGCHLALSAVELDRIRHEPPDALVSCEECGRLLVR